MSWLNHMQCSHEKKFSADCTQCEIIGLQESLSWHQKRVDSTTARLIELGALRSTSGNAAEREGDTLYDEWVEMNTILDKEGRETVSVPVVPTIEMVSAGCAAHKGGGLATVVMDVYSAMIGARPAVGNGGAEHG